MGADRTGSRHSDSEILLTPRGRSTTLGIGSFRCHIDHGHYNVSKSTGATPEGTIGAEAAGLSQRSGSTRLRQRSGPNYHGHVAHNKLTVRMRRL